MQLNQPAPDFELPDPHGSLHKLSDECGRIVILNFWSAECPHSERTDRHLLSLLEKWGGSVVLLPIAANQNEPIMMIRESAKRRNLPRVLVDAEHRVADLYKADTTPQAFVLDREGILRYRGAVDNVGFRQREPTRFFVHEAVEALLRGDMPELGETPTFGCTIVREI